MLGRYHDLVGAQWLSERFSGHELGDAPFDERRHRHPGCAPQVCGAGLEFVSDECSTSDELMLCCLFEQFVLTDSLKGGDAADEIPGALIPDTERKSMSHATNGTERPR